MPVTRSPTLPIVEMNVKRGNNDNDWSKYEDCVEAHHHKSNDQRSPMRRRTENSSDSANFTFKSELNKWCLPHKNAIDSTYFL